MATLAETYPEQAMPRERLLQVGAEGCSDAELLAILLRTGTKEVNVVELATKITKEFGNLYELKTATIDELCRTSGIGTAKAIQVKAALELGARMHRALQPKIGRVRSSADLAYSLMDELRDKPQEHLLCIYLNTKNEIIHKQVLFIGSLNQSVAHPREIFRVAVRVSAARVICCHNHPSGNPKPSENDLLFTQRLKECGELMGIELLDHLILGHDRYISLREEGLWQ